MNNFRRLNTVRSRMLILAISIEVLMLSILVANSTRLLNSAMIKQTYMQAEQICPVLAAALTAPLAQRDFATVQAVIEESRSSGGIDYIAISDKTGKITAATGWQDNSALPGPTRSLDFSIFKQDSCSRYDVVIPISQQGQHLGTLHLGLNLTQIIIAKRSLLLQGIGIAAIEILLSSIVLFFTIMWLTRHLDALTRASLRVAAGDFAPSGFPEGSDDIGQLGKAFNTMSSAISERVDDLTKARNELREYSKQLKQLNSTLESRIQVEISRNRDKDQKLIQSEKMASIGQLAAGVAHEINNPMGFIASNLNSLGKYLLRIKDFIVAQDESIAGYCQDDQAGKVSEIRKKLKIDHILQDTAQLISESLEGADRVQHIVQGLKSFSRIDQAKLTPVDMNECLDTTINVVWNEIKYIAELQKNYGKLPPVMCYPQQINQVFLNLLVNAAQSMREKGVITIRTWHEDHCVFISISDTGSGILAEHLNRIFEPFFTTKEVGKGTGLGLSISYDIIKTHRGDVKVESSPANGTTFTVRLPEDGMDDVIRQ